MIGDYKPYEERLGRYGDQAEERVLMWLNDIGYRAAAKCDKYAPDITCDMGDWSFTVEVERCQKKRWPDGSVPIRFDKISVIERRLKYFRTGINMVVSSDMKAGYVILRSVAKRAARLCSELDYYNGERRLLIPTGWCQLCDFNVTQGVSLGMTKGELFNEQTS